MENNDNYLIPFNVENSLRPTLISNKINDTLFESEQLWIGQILS